MSYDTLLLQATTFDHFAHVATFILFFFLKKTLKLAGKKLSRGQGTQEFYLRVAKDHISIYIYIYI
jgi:hypothetical protein